MEMKMKASRHRPLWLVVSQREI